MVKNKKLILHLGPARTSTTYLYSVLMANDLINKTVCINIPHAQTQLYRDLEQQVTMMDDPQLLFKVYQFCAEVKEDQSFTKIVNHSTHGHMLSPKLDSEKFSDLLEFWLNRLFEQPINPSHSANKDEIHRWNNTTHGWAKRDLMNNQISHHDLSEFSKLLPPQLAQTYSDISLRTATQRDKEVMMDPQIPLLVCLPTLTTSRMLWQHKGVGVGGYVKNSMSGQWDVSRFNGTVHQDSVTQCIPQYQQWLKQIIHALCERFEQVTVCVGQRDPAERMNSYHRYVKRAFTDTQFAMITDSIQHHSYSHSEPEYLRSWIDSQLKFHADLPIISTLFDCELPHNCELTVANHDELNTATELNNFVSCVPNTRLNLSVNRNSISHTAPLEVPTHSVWQQLNNSAYQTIALWQKNQ